MRYFNKTIVIAVGLLFTLSPVVVGAQSNDMSGFTLRAGPETIPEVGSIAFPTPENNSSPTSFTLINGDHSGDIGTNNGASTGTLKQPGSATTTTDNSVIHINVGEPAAETVQTELGQIQSGTVVAPGVIMITPTPADSSQNSSPSPTTTTNDANSNNGGAVTGNSSNNDGNSNTPSAQSQAIASPASIKQPASEATDAQEYSFSAPAQNTVIRPVSVEPTKTTSIEVMNERAALLVQSAPEALLSEIGETRNMTQEAATEAKYVKTLVEKITTTSEAARQGINVFITYGVDDNTKKLGAGERAAVMHSYQSAFGKLPETDDEFTDAIKIANGRWPSKTNEQAEARAKSNFSTIYKRSADMNNPRDNAAVTIMAYGLRQRAENRNLTSEQQGIKTFKSVYKTTPSSTDEWNIMQAITYSGATR